jgi:hypothetical protein
MEIAVPQTTVSVCPGVETRVRIHISNPGDAAVPVRIGLARGRLSAWARAEPSVVSAGPGESTGVDLVFRPPATALPTSALQPFTVQVEDMRDGSVTARATGLLSVATPARLSAELALVRARRRRVELRLTVANATGTPLTVRVRPVVESVGEGTARPGAPADRAARKAARRAERRVTAKPIVLELPGGQDATARVVARPRRAFIGTRLPYVVTVRCSDAIADASEDVAAQWRAAERTTPTSGPGRSDPMTSGAAGVTSGLNVPADDEPAPPLATVTHAGLARPRLARPTATVLGLLLVAALTGGAVWLGREGELSDVVNRLRPGGGQAQQDPVRRPFVIVDVFQKRGADGGREIAEAAREDFNAGGMQVRVVDSLTSAELEDEATGFWVVLRDGFASVDAARAYCQQYRILAPNCQVVP